MTKIGTSTVAYMYVASGARRVEPVASSVSLPAEYPQDTDLSRLHAQDIAEEYSINGQIKRYVALGRSLGKA